MNPLTEFLSIGIVGSALSIAIQFIKAKWGTDSTLTKVVTVILALFLGTAYYLLVDTALWIPIVGILGTASTFYALFLKDTGLGDGIKNIAL